MSFVFSILTVFGGKNDATRLTTKFTSSYGKANKYGDLTGAKSEAPIDKFMI